MRGAHRRCWHVLQQRVVFIDGSVAAHANPLGRPTAGLPQVNGRPMHVAIRQFLPRSIRGSMGGVCQKQPRAAERQDVWWGPRCNGLVVLARGGVVIRGWLWCRNAMRTAAWVNASAAWGGHGARQVGQRRSRTLATRWATQPRCNAWPHVRAKGTHRDKPGRHPWRGKLAGTARHC